MIDPVSASLGWFLVPPILTELGKAALDDYVKDFFKDWIKDVEGLAKKPFAKDAVRDAHMFRAGIRALGFREKTDRAISATFKTICQTTSSAASFGKCVSKELSGFKYCYLS
jgi:hypothetical protein